MLQPIRQLAGAWPERFRAGAGRRATGFAAALAIEALLLALLVGLGQTSAPKKQPLVTLSTFDARSEPEPPPPAPDQAKPRHEQLAQPVPQPPQPEPQPQPQPPQPTATPPPLIQLPRNQSSFSIANLPQMPPRPAKAEAAFGPQDTGVVGDSPRIGTAPDGSPLYGASWYREPTDAEVAAFLARAQTEGRSWGRIACKTAPDFRVEDCVPVDEFPDNSHLANAVLSAAWQFRVRPPWKGGHSLIGSWVQITILYDEKHKPDYGQ